MRSIIIKLIFTALLAASTYVTLVSAADHEINWTTGSLYARIRSPVAGSGYCEKEQVQIVPYDATIERETQTISACVVHGNNVDMLEGLVSSGSGMSQVNRQYAIRIGQDKVFHYLDTTTRWSYMLSGDDIITAVEDDRYRIAVIKDARAALKPVQKWIDSRGVARMYTFDLGSAGVYRKTSNSWMGDISVSRNGQYITSQQGNYLTRTNTENGNEVRYILPEKDNHAVGTVRAITNDGSIGLLSGNHSIIDFDSCETETDWMTGYHGMEVRCATRSFKDTITPLTGELGSVEMYALFSDGGETLTFSLYNAEHKFMTVVVSLRYQGNNDSSEATPLRYLALGDSYGSGEGDIIRDVKTGKKHYREYTDYDGVVEVDGYREKLKPEERCHVSDRSYPYLLANSMKLGDVSKGGWQTVACAGATTYDVTEHNAANYEGQGMRLRGYDIVSLQDEASKKFIPGRQKQIEFVKKYQPQVITVMMGGNDVGFGGKLSTCALSVSTCQFAQANWRSKLQKELAAEFASLASLYSELAKATGNKAKIYVVGYPQFINAEPEAKCRNTLLFDEKEREMVVNSVIYLNNLIEVAAKKAGVTYIDVENSFGEHRVCDVGSQHVNAIVGIGGWDGNQVQESFHPNHLGHEDLSLAIWKKTGGTSLFDYKVCAEANEVICPDPSANASDAIVPPYFKNVTDKSSSRVAYYMLTDGTLMKSTKEEKKTTVRGAPMTYRKNTKVDVTLYSSPVRLGMFMTDSEGGFSAEIAIPSTIPAGLHTITASGLTESGEFLELYQIILIKGPDEDDVDEDGIRDDIDKCLFIPTLRLDGDGDGVDDACDPIVDVPDKFVLSPVSRGAEWAMKTVQVGLHSGDAQDQDVRHIGEVSIPGHDTPPIGGNMLLTEKVVATRTNDKDKKDNEKRSFGMMLSIAAIGIGLAGVGYISTQLRKRGK